MTTLHVIADVRALLHGMLGDGQGVLVLLGNDHVEGEPAEAAQRAQENAFQRLGQPVHRAAPCA